MRRFFREVYMDSVFPILNSTELPPYIWGNDEREKVSLLSSQFRNINVQLFSFSVPFNVRYLFRAVRRGGLMVSALDSESNGPGSRLSRGAALCSQAREFTLTVPLSTQVYTWVPTNLLLGGGGVTLRQTNIPSRGEQQYSQSLTGISSGCMGHLARTQTLPLPYLFRARASFQYLQH